MAVPCTALWAHGIVARAGSHYLEESDYSYTAKKPKPTHQTTSTQKKPCYHYQLMVWEENLFPQSFAMDFHVVRISLAP